MSTNQILRSVLCALCVSTVAADAASELSSEQKGWLSHARRSEKGGWIYLHTEGGARERGFQHGYLLSKEIVEALRVTRAGWEYQSAMDWSWLVRRASSMFVPKMDEESLTELAGIAEGVSAAGTAVSRDDILTYNGIIELAEYWWPAELKKIKDGPAQPPRESCSSFIATGSWTKDGNIVLGHNTMMSYESAFPNVIQDIAPARGHRILWQTNPGWIHSGTDFFITDAGIVGSETTIGGFEGFETNGIPEFARMRRATQDANSIEQWCEIMKRGNNGGYANAWLIGDVNTKEIARLELGLRNVGYEKKQDGYFVGCNVAEDRKILRFETSSKETDIRDSSVARRVRWKQVMKQYSGKIDVSLAEHFEADHFDTFLGKEHPSGRTLCGHFELESEPAGNWPGVPFGDAGTVDGKVVDSSMAKKMSFAARWGSACGMPFSAAKYLAAHPQFDWMADILKDRPSQAWVTFRAGE